MGAAEGAAEGAAFGVAVGAAEGVAFGAAEGVALGAAEGAAFGAAEGAALGAAEGAAFGAAEGAAFGAAEGDDAFGAAVGAVLEPPGAAAARLAKLCGSGRGVMFPASRNELCVRGLETVILETGLAAALWCKLAVGSGVTVVATAGFGLTGVAAMGIVFGFCAAGFGAGFRTAGLRAAGFAAATKILFIAPVVFAICFVLYILRFISVSSSRPSP